MNKRLGWRISGAGRCASGLAELRSVTSGCEGIPDFTNPVDDTCLPCVVLQRTDEAQLHALKRVLDHGQGRIHRAITRRELAKRACS